MDCPGTNIFTESCNLLNCNGRCVYLKFFTFIKCIWQISFIYLMESTWKHEMKIEKQLVGFMATVVSGVHLTGILIQPKVTFCDCSWLKWHDEKLYHITIFCKFNLENKTKIQLSYTLQSNAHSFWRSRLVFFSFLFILELSFFQVRWIWYESWACIQTLFYTDTKEQNLESALWGCPWGDISQYYLNACQSVLI